MKFSFRKQALTITHLLLVCGIGILQSKLLVQQQNLTIQLHDIKSYMD